MIEKLTKGQEDLLSVYRDKWLTIGLSTERINKEQAKKDFLVFNQLVLGNKETPLFIFMDSPLTAWIATCYLYTWTNQKKNIWSQVESQVKSQVWSQVESQVQLQVESQVKSQVESQVWSQVWSQVESQVESFVYPYLGGNFDSSYFSFYDYCNKVLKINFQYQEKWDSYLNLSQMSLIYPLKEFVVISEKPIEIKMKSGILHNENGASVKYADGVEIYNLNGVRVSKEIVMTPPEKLNPELLIKEQNAEVRREIIRKIGMSRILQKLKAEHLDSWREYSLYRIDKIDIEPIQILKMTCPSTGTYYSLRIPPEIKTAREAINWCNWGNDPEKILVES